MPSVRKWITWLVVRHIVFLKYLMVINISTRANHFIYKYREINFLSMTGLLLDITFICVLWVHKWPYLMYLKRAGNFAFPIWVLVLRKPSDDANEHTFSFNGPKMATSKGWNVRYWKEHLCRMVAYFCPLHVSYFSTDYVNMQDKYVNMQDKN